MIGFDFDAHEARMMERMTRDMALLEAILSSLETMPHQTLENIDTPEYEAQYAAWKVKNDELMALSRQRIAERTGTASPLQSE